MGFQGTLCNQRSLPSRSSQEAGVGVVVVVGGVVGGVGDGVGDGGMGG